MQTAHGSGLFAWVLAVKRAAVAARAPWATAATKTTRAATGAATGAAVTASTTAVAVAATKAATAATRAALGHHVHAGAHGVRLAVAGA